MKTTNYNLGKGVVTLIIVAMISFVSSAAIKGNEMCTSGTKTEAVKSNTTEALVSTRSEAIAETLQNWMTNGSYWQDEKTANTENETSANLMLNNKLVEWMSNGSYWSDSLEQTQNKFASNLQDWMSSGSYWNPEE